MCEPYVHGSANSISRILPKIILNRSQHPNTSRKMNKKQIKVITFLNIPKQKGLKMRLSLK